MEGTNKTLLLLIGFLLLSQYEAKRDSKEVDCLKYVFAPACRGAMTKRALQKLEPLFEERRTPRYNPNEEKFVNSDPYPINRGSNDNSLYDKVLLETLFKKIAPKNADYDTGTSC